MPRPRQSQAKVEAMRERILDAALELLHDEGPDALSIRAIADRASVSHMVLYTYFENRAALIAALRERQRQRMDARHDELLRRAESGNVKAVLRESLAQYAHIASSRPHMYRFLWVQPMAESDCPADQRKRLEVHLHYLAQLVEIGVRRGACVVEDPLVAAITACGIVNAPLILYHSGRLVSSKLRDKIADEALRAAMEYLCGKTDTLGERR